MNACPSGTLQCRAKRAPKRTGRRVEGNDQMPSVARHGVQGSDGLGGAGAVGRARDDHLPAGSAEFRRAVEDALRVAGGVSSWPRISNESLLAPVKGAVGTTCAKAVEPIGARIAAQTDANRMRSFMVRGYPGTENAQGGAGARRCPTGSRRTSWRAGSPRLCLPGLQPDRARRCSSVNSPVGRALGGGTTTASRPCMGLPRPPPVEARTRLAEIGFHRLPGGPRRAPGRAPSRRTETRPGARRTAACGAASARPTSGACSRCSSSPSACRRGRPRTW
jgi:hypothetical protein